MNLNHVMRNKITLAVTIIHKMDLGGLNIQGDGMSLAATRHLCNRNNIAEPALIFRNCIIEAKSVFRCATT